jgi:hypothetical protein
MRLKRAVAAGAGPGGISTAVVECALSKKYPALSEFLSSLTWEDGSVRATGTITLMCDQGVMKAALNDRDSMCGTFVSGRSLTALLEAIEAGLAGGSLEWRAKAAPPPRRGK